MAQNSNPHARDARPQRKNRARSVMDMSEKSKKNKFVDTALGFHFVNGQFHICVPGQIVADCGHGIERVGVILLQPEHRSLTALISLHRHRNA